MLQLPIREPYFCCLAILFLTVIVSGIDYLILVKAVASLKVLLGHHFLIGVELEFCMMGVGETSL
uniref:Uncharacterized protein n=1 Tax=Rhizophora mucronata TaxID=61149 RepID=A0A2P2LCF3_RHIMU